MACVFPMIERVDMELFNQALLAEKVWRILQNSKSLVARVLGSHYFSGGNILRSRLGHALSYIWRSLYWGKDLLEKGMIWQIS